MPTGHESSLGSAHHSAERRFSEPELEQAVERALVLAFAPLHKRVFGTAVGVAAALVVAAATYIAVLRAPTDTGLWTLAAYFRGYAVSWAGLVIGAAWAGAVGFIAGWFLAFVRNFLLATWLLFIRVRANLSQTHDFLDHI